MHSQNGKAASIVLEEWEPKQLQVATYLSKGFTWEETAEKCNISMRTVANYCKLPGYHQFIRQLAANHHRELEPALMRNFLVALDVQHEVLLGRLDAKSDRYATAQQLIQVLIRQLAARRPEPSVDVPAASAGAPIDVTPSVNGNGVHPS